MTRMLRVLLFACLPTSAALAQAGPPIDRRASLEARRTHLGQLTSSFTAVQAELGEPQPDFARVKGQATVLSSFAPQLTGWTPPSAGWDAGVRTAPARAAMAKDPKGWTEQADTFTAQATRLKKAADNGDLHESRLALQAVQTSCDTCHNRFGLPSAPPGPPKVG